MSDWVTMNECERLRDERDALVAALKTAQAVVDAAREFVDAEVALEAASKSWKGWTGEDRGRVATAKTNLHRYVVWQRAECAWDSLSILARNIRDAAIGCASFERGWDQRSDQVCAEKGIISKATCEYRRWYPGCAL